MDKTNIHGALLFSYAADSLQIRRKMANFA